MYHIANDKRQQATADKIRDGLISCLSVKQMTEISVSDISSAAGVSRSTFYRSFDMPLDVLSYACDKVVEMIVRDYSEVEINDVDTLIQFSLNYWKQHTDLLEAAVNCDRLDIPRKAFENHSDKLIGDFMGLVKKDFTELEIDYIRKGIVGLMSNLLVVWISHGKKETPAQLYELYKKFRGIMFNLQSGNLVRKIGQQDTLSYMKDGHTEQK